MEGIIIHALVCKMKPLISYKGILVAIDAMCCQKRIAQTARLHWNIENELHWSLDVCFGEDLSRARIVKKIKKAVNVSAHHARSTPSAMKN